MLIQVELGMIYTLAAARSIVEYSLASAVWCTGVSDIS